MSVMLISDLELSRLAVFARKQGFLPPSVSASDFARRLRDANLSRWQANYPDKDPNAAPLDTALIETACLMEGEAAPVGILRTVRSLHYNANLFRGSFLMAVLSRCLDRAGAQWRDAHPWRPSKF